MSAIVLPFRRIECAQSTPEWYAARAGRLTGSKADCVLAKPRSGQAEAVTRRDYRIQMALERVTGRSLEDSFQSRDMLWGKEHEPDARLGYEALTGALVEQIGFCQHPSLPVGCSLDGWMPEELEVAGMVLEAGRPVPMGGFIEIKCPKSATHLEYLNTSRVPADYVPQVVHNFWITNAAWCDFISYDPRMPKKLQFFVTRVTRDEEQIRTWIGHALQFLAEVRMTEETILRRAA
jgi:hypothetical protein